MGMVMMPSAPLIGAAAVGVAVAYAFTPWSRWARERCREMTHRQPREPRLRDAVAVGVSYTACCIVSSARISEALNHSPGSSNLGPSARTGSLSVPGGPGVRAAAVAAKW